MEENNQGLSVAVSEETDLLQKKKERSQRFFIAEAAVEYFIALCVTSTFLTIILEEMKVPTAYQGVISSIASLSCVFQLVGVFFVKRKLFNIHIWKK